jgi:hypothetical protein
LACRLEKTLAGIVVFEKVLPILCLCELGGQSKAWVEAGFARRRKAMHKEDSKGWGREMKPKWEAAPQA